MKKIITSIAIVIFSVLMLTVPVYALNKVVNITAASATNSEVTASGTTDALAIIVQVRDKNGDILDMKSFGTSGGAFSITMDGLTLTSGESYKVYIADYEGGDWAIKEVTVPSHVHVFQNYTYNNDATCEKNGTMTGACACGEKDTIEDPSHKALGHSYTATFVWAEDCKSAVVNLVCTRSTCSDTDKGHKVAVEATVTSQKQGNEIIYTAVASYAGKEYTETKKVDAGLKNTPPTGDDFPIAVVVSLMAVASVGGIFVAVKRKK
ncbi:MAG: hypothetical protein J6K43_07405 [Lachnospiraceae bacterium]|nr:hypothetical protein [Lachnospiraceae bacterium]